MADIRTLLESVNRIEQDYDSEVIHLHDSFDIELSENFVIETGVVGFTEDGIILEADEQTLEFLDLNGVLLEDVELTEKMVMGVSSDASSAGSFKMGENDELSEIKKMVSKMANEGSEMDEAKYQGRTVPLGKPMAGDVKKSKVYVKGPKGNVVKVNFGDKNMKIKKSNPKRRKSFRARHNCANPGPRWKARYWSCRAW